MAEKNGGYTYDSYCGIYCGACDIMLAGKTGGTYPLASFWDEHTVRKFHKRLGIAGEENRPYTLQCGGCKSGDLFVNCAVCGIRKCAVGKKVEHCSDCSEYPCGLITEVRKFEKLLPHIGGNSASLERISAAGVGQWLSEEEARWRCPGCGGSFSWYTERCGGCGRDLRKHAYRFSFLRALLLKMGIMLAPRRKE